ncbi:MAG: TonB-dependent receptor [Bryobacterales bacterium]|nr:TonB-dependent receptor [Bryobacterales bacterium]
MRHNPIIFVRRILALASIAFAVSLSMQQAAAQSPCLEVRVLDPTSAQLPTAAVSVGSKEVPVDDSGVALLCDLGPGPHSVVVFAPGFEPQEVEVLQATGQITVVLQIEAVTQELVVVGTRAEARTVTESLVPVDVIAAEEFVQQGGPDLLSQLRNVVPSFNVTRQPIADAATIIRPANLRNLAPDHTLVLVNGKRRHRGAVITWIGGGVADGSQGADISVIPSIALKQVEVLRDGASAQYGSDAIAGVLNFTLKDAPSGGSVEVRAGTYQGGDISGRGPDGHNITYAANVGMPLGEGGFANLSFEYGNSDPTDRSVQRADAAALIAAGNTAVRNPAQIWGSPEERNNSKFFANFGKLVGESTQAYGHLNYASRKVTGGFFFRNPNTRSAVFSGDGGKTLLVGDALDAQDGILDGSAGCPVVPVVDHVPDQAALSRVFSDPNCFSFQELFPGGFTPNFGGFYIDNSAVGGIRGQFAGGLRWDASASVGTSEVDFFINNTVNASLGPDTPTEFKPGLYRQQDLNLNFDIAYEASELVHFAAGAEVRNEQFTIEEGQEESWTFGPYAQQGFSAASNGFPGFSPIAVGNWNRRNSALYADIELSDAENRLIWGGALRFERFADFGNTLNWKTAARAEVAGGFAVRASASTGFRAPTPGQQNAFNVSTIFDPAIGELVNRGTIPSNSKVAALRGGHGLRPETSMNFTAGAIAEAGIFTLTADFFRIAVSDRLTLSKNFTLMESEVTDLIAEGVTSARNLSSFRFFVNDFDTVTQGIDIVAVLAPTARSELSFLYNHTGTNVTEYDPELLSDERIRRLQYSLPMDRLNATWKQRVGRFNLMGRLSYYGEWYERRDNYTYPGEWIVDFEIDYRLGKGVSIAGGAQNALNKFTDISPSQYAVGLQFSQASPFGFNGAYWYTRLNYSWGTSF